jgi:antitoxin component of MazEF toxin-antitoxin module
MTSRAQKPGNCWSLQLPRQVLDLANIAGCEAVEILGGNQQILIKKSQKTKDSLAELVSRIQPDYEAEEINSGAPVGREEW